jgi:hypothetical protein
MKMNYFRQLKVSILVLGICICLASISSFRLANAVAEESPDTKETTPAATTENKIPASSEKESKPTEPDVTGDEEANEEESDIFDLKLSTYILINEAYDRIFTPELITDDGLVKYSTLKRKRLDVLAAKRELKKLNPAILMSLSKEERIAFWINTYNFCTIRAILDNYPIKPKWFMIIYPDDSIMQITGVWTKVFFDIQREEYNLHEIEQEKLLERYKDPRICFALSNASVGGATLRNELYEGERLDEQLDDQVKKYIATDKGLRWDKDNDTLLLSNVFQAHTQTFLESEKWASIKKFRKRKDKERIWLNFILPHLSKDDIRYLETNEFKIKFIEFDWHLNEIK